MERQATERRVGKGKARRGAARRAEWERLTAGLTEEQAAVVAAAEAGRELRVAAFAGSGKTTTLVAVAGALAGRGRRVLYLTFNRAVAEEVRARVAAVGLGGAPTGPVTVLTTHGLAYRALYRRLAAPLAKDPAQVAGVLSQMREVEECGRLLGMSAMRAAHVVLRVVQRFLQSADAEPAGAHVPVELLMAVALRPDTRQAARELLVGVAREIWRAWDRDDTRIPITHDVYLKRYERQRPDLSGEYDAILFDESQDANPVMVEIVGRQTVQRVLVGDPHQQIYEWRGAVNAMERAGFGEVMALTRSFRFGPQIAGVATGVLRAFKGEARVLRGVEAVEDQVEWGEKGAGTRAVVTRTNGGAIEAFLEAVREGQRPYWAGRLEELRQLWLAAYGLYSGDPPMRPEFGSVTSWGEWVELVEECPPLAHWKPVIGLVERYRERSVELANRLAEWQAPSEEAADVVITTAHQAKGREWESVRIAGDFCGHAPARAVGEGVEIDEEEANVTYVAVTRARRRLVLGAYGEALRQAWGLVRQARLG